MEVAQQIRRLRLEQGLTQKQVGEPNYTAAYVSVVEAGKREPTSAAVAHFAARLGVTPDELVSGKSAMERADLMSGYAAGRRSLLTASPEGVEDARRLFETVARKARKRGYPDVEASCSVGLGLCAEAENDLRGALAHHAHAEELMRRASPLARIDAVVGRARVLQSMGSVARAVFLIEKAVAELEDEGLEDPSALLRLHASLVAAYFDAGLLEEAGASAEVALSLVPRVDDPERLANMYLNVGLMLAQQGRAREAEERLSQAKANFDLLNSQSDLARVQLVAGINLRNEGRFDEARTHFRAAQMIFAGAGNTLREARVSVAMGVLERMADRADDALLLLKRAMRLAGEDVGIVGIAQRELALCHSERDSDLAVKEMRKAIALLEEAELSKDLAAAYRALGDLLSSRTDLADACEAYKKASQVIASAA
jgi:tetratricopeptide (TPR) repeat protein